MSCPYLEKGKIAYCHAFGEERIEVEKSDIEEACFSGEFSDCSFFFSRCLANTGQEGDRKILSAGLS